MRKERHSTDLLHLEECVWGVTLNVNIMLVCLQEQSNWHHLKVASWRAGNVFGTLTDLWIWAFTSSICMHNKNRRVWMYFCSASPPKLLHRTSKSTWDINCAVLWPSVAGSLMISTILAETVRRFPLRAGLFDLSAELVECMGHGERCAGQP